MPTVLIVWAMVQDPIPPMPNDPLASKDKWVGTVLPRGVLYQPYLADPRQARSSVKFSIAGSDGSNAKIENTFGLVRSIVRWQEGDEAYEIEFEAAAFSRFDTKEHWDLDATDYRFGFPFVYRSGDLAYKFHLWHLTSHLGDEFIERTGRKRDSYHLNEAAFGVSWDPEESLRLYGEVGLAVYTGTATDSGRVQLGLEWVDVRAKGPWVPYAAMDLQSRNEIDWSVNRAIAAGFLVRVGENARALRFALEYYDGRDLQTQFLDQRERTLSLMLAAELF